MKRRFLLLFCLLSGQAIHAVHLDPVLPRFYEITPSFEQSFTYSNTRNIHWSSFQTLGGEVSVCWPISYTCPCKVYDVQAEIQVAETAVQHIRIDHFNITALKQWNDHFLFGATLQQTLRKALQDPSSFHHGLLEGQFHIAYGKDMCISPCYVTRGYITGTLGVADVGVPWLESSLHWYMQAQFTFDCYVKAIVGLGSKSFHPHHFHGYGSVKHRSIDIGASYIYQIEDGRRWDLELSSRILAVNTAKFPIRFCLTYIFPFGI